MKNIKLLSQGFLCVLSFLIALSSFVLPAAAAPELPSLDGATSVYLWNFESESLILSKNESEFISPSSSTKMMTGLVAIELVGDRLDEKVTVTREMLSGVQGAALGLKVGEALSYRDLLYATVCSGFNDAAYVLAHTSADGIDAFVALMNEYAERLGAKNTHYTNPSGWHDENMITTLSDTAKIAKEAAKNELYMTVSSASTYELPATNKSVERTIHNRNGLIGSFYALGYYNRHARGLIAGMTDEAGCSVITYFEYDGLSFLCIVMGAQKLSDENIRSYAIANDLISYAIYHYGPLELVKKGDLICEIPLKYALSSSDESDGYMLPCVAAEDLAVYMPYDRQSMSTLEIREYFFEGQAEAPIREGDIVGAADVFVDGIHRGTVAICAAESVEANSFLIFIDSLKSFLTGRVFIISLLAFLVMFSLYYYFVELKMRKRKTKNINPRNLY